MRKQRHIYTLFLHLINPFMSPRHLGVIVWRQVMPTPLLVLTRRRARGRTLKVTTVSCGRAHPACGAPRRRVVCCHWQGLVGGGLLQTATRRELLRAALAHCSAHTRKCVPHPAHGAIFSPRPRHHAPLQRQLNNKQHAQNKAPKRADRARGALWPWRARCCPVAGVSAASSARQVLGAPEARPTARVKPVCKPEDNWAFAWSAKARWAHAAVPLALACRRRRQRL